MSGADTPPRAIGFWIASTLVIGNMIGSGAFLLPASLAPYGAGSLYGWAVSVAGALLLASVFAHLASRHPRAGGPYAYAHYAFGHRIGFAVAWCYWVSIWCATAAIAVAFAGSVGALCPALTATPTRAALCALSALWLCTGFNILGVRTAGSVQGLTTVLKLLPLVAIAALGAFWAESANLAPPDHQAGGLLEITSATTALTLWSLQGLESATVPAGHVRDPARTIPRATLFGTAVAAVVTVAACTVVLMLAPAGELRNSSAPFADVARRLWGSWAGVLMAATATISCFGALNGWTLMQGQIPQAAANDGLFPAAFARADANGTPRFGLLAGSVLATALVIANYGGSLVQLFTWSILLSTAAALVPYCASVAAALRLASRKDERRWLVVATLALFYSLWALAGTGREALTWGFGLLLAGAPVYVANRISARRRAVEPDA